MITNLASGLRLFGLKYRLYSFGTLGKSFNCSGLQFLMKNYDKNETCFIELLWVSSEIIPLMHWYMLNIQ